MRPAAATDTSAGAAAVASPHSTTSGAPHSSWHSPIPYLFGGLAAMLGLIALALLILVCSYWKVSGYLGTGDDAAAGAPPGTDDDDSEAPGDADAAAGSHANKSPPALFERSIVVIMAGDCKPTFLATPSASCCAASSNDEGRSSREDGSTSVDERHHRERGVRTAE